MTPDIELQLQTVIKSLRDNVLPAVDPENALAQQQIQLSLATLDIVLEHLPWTHRFVREDIAIHTTLAEQVLVLCTLEACKAYLDKALDDARLALTDPALGFVQLQVQARRLRDAVGQVVSEHGGSDVAVKLEKLVLQASVESLALGRAWNKPMGFEPDPQAVADVAEQLAVTG